ncbi:hypothetical protein KM043_013319 [Ampulex compressa]|nr:hypothetical protein KM043_013319 [Ampulex compressa]
MDLYITYSSWPMSCLLPEATAADARFHVFPFPVELAERRPEQSAFPRCSKELKIPARPRVEEVEEGGKGAAWQKKKEASADKAFDIRLIVDAADRAGTRRQGGDSAIYDVDGDSSLKVEPWPVAKLNPA